MFALALACCLCVVVVPLLCYLGDACYGFAISDPSWHSQHDGAGDSKHEDVVWRCEVIPCVEESVCLTFGLRYGVLALLMSFLEFLLC